MRKRCLIQEKMRLLACASLLAISPLYATGAPKPMSDSDMGDVSAESGDILNVMGSTASGETSDAQPKSPSSASDNVAYIETDKPIESTVDHTLTPSYGDSKDVVSTFKISERGNGEIGSSTIFYDEKDSIINVSHSKSTLSISQNVQIQEVRIHNVRSAPTAPIRGDYALQSIHVTGAASITTR